MLKRPRGLGKVLSTEEPEAGEMQKALCAPCNLPVHVGSRQPWLTGTTLAAIIGDTKGDTSSLDEKPYGYDGKENGNNYSILGYTLGL